MRPRLIGALATALVLTATAAACSSGGGGDTRATAAPGRTLVVETSFQLTTLDPARMFEPTGLLLDRALYDTLLTYRGGDVKTPVPDLATSYTASKDARTYTFALDPRARFADGTPVTAADVVFSLDRVKNIAGNPSFLMAGITPTARGTHTVVLTSGAANTAIPAIVTNPALGIVEAAVVRKDGGTDAAGAATLDHAESALDARSAGSGPYTLASYSTTTQVVITANPRYWGTKPAYARIVVRNVAAAVQKLDVLRGESQIAVDLSPAQATGMSGVQVIHGASADVFFLILNESPAVSTVTSNKLFQTAVKLAINYAGLVQLAGAGAVQASGIIPSTFAGSLPEEYATKTDLAKSRAALARSGNRTPAVTLSFPTGVEVEGLSFADLATRVKNDLGQVGIQATLRGSTVQTALAGYRAGTDQIGLWEWGPDFPDPADYLNFLPGALVGLRARWERGAFPALETLGARAATTTSTAARLAIYRKMQRMLNAKGPYVPLIQPAQVLVAGRTVTNVTANPLWLVDLTELG